MRLTKQQTKAIDFLEDSITTDVLFGGGAGGAKSYLGCYWVLKNCLKYPGVRSVIGRWKRKNLYETTLNSFWQVCQEQGVRPEIHYKFNAQDGKITFFNGSEILLKDLFTYPSDPNFDSLGSLEITFAFIDEANQVSVMAKNILKSRIRYKLDEYNLIPKILYTCNPSKNWVYSELYKPFISNTLPENKAFIRALAKDNPFISKHYIKLLEELPKNSRERLLHGNWEYDDDPATLIDIDSCNDYFTNEHVQKTGLKYITGDIARKGRDTTVIRVWDGMVVIERVSMKVSLVTESATMVRQLANKHDVPMSRCVIDEDGVGGGVVDILSCEGFVNNSKALNGENYNNLKSQCSFLMAKKIVAKEVYEKCSDSVLKGKIIEEFEQVKQDNIDNDGKVSIISKDKVKDNIGRSPDEWDSIMMRGYFEITQEQGVIGW
jgi:hypothetical protein